MGGPEPEISVKRVRSEVRAARAATAVVLVTFAAVLALIWTWRGGRWH